MGFAAKRVVPRLPVALLLLAALFVDVLWGIAIDTGLEHARIAPGITRASALDLYDFPWSHSLLAVVFWSLLVGGAFFLWRRNRKGAVVLGLLVLSHWFLDFASHRPDMPIGIHGPYVGLGLWNSVPATIAVEEAMAIAGVWLYLTATRARNAAGRYGLFAWVALMLASAIPAYTMAPPADTNVKALAASNFFLLVLLAILHLIDRQREPVAE